MNSTQPNEPYRQLSLWDNVADSPQNIQRDDLVEAWISPIQVSDTDRFALPKVQSSKYKRSFAVNTVGVSTWISRNSLTEYPTTD